MLSPPGPTTAYFRNCRTGTGAYIRRNQLIFGLGSNLRGSTLEASGRLVGPPVFKTGERLIQSLAGSIPVRLRQPRE